MRINKKAADYRTDRSSRLAGGYGTYAAVQNPEALLRRTVMACLLWENLAYESGGDTVAQIRNLVPQVEPLVVFDIADKARNEQGLRHVPLLLAYEMTKYENHKGLVGDLLPRVIKRPDQITDYLSIYWQDGKRPLSAQSKIGLAQSFHGFDAYQLAKWSQKDKQIKLRDALRLVHPTPRNKEEAALWGQLKDGTLPVPDTWEVALSTGKDKKATWERLIRERKLGANAFLKNLRNMEGAGVDRDVIMYGFTSVNPRWLLPIDYIAAAKAVPRWEQMIEQLMLKGLEKAPKLHGRTVFVVDTSGSMGTHISSMSQYRRIDVALAMAMLAREVCDDITIYATAGNDGARAHATGLVPSRRGFGLGQAILGTAGKLGGGGIFTRQCLEYIRGQERGDIDRIMIFSDSQDCDWPDKRIPAPFGEFNYIIDVSANSRGINYDGVWTAEVSGWSQHFIKYVLAYEGNAVQQGELE
jgi:hypothetical protein